MKVALLLGALSGLVVLLGPVVGQKAPSGNAIVEGTRPVTAEAERKPDEQVETELFLAKLTEARARALALRERNKQEVDNTEGRVQSVSAEIEGSQKEAAAYVREKSQAVDQLNSRANKVQFESAETRDHIDKLSQDILTEQEKAEKAKQEIVKRQAEIESLTKKREALKSSVSNRKSELEKVNSDLAQLRTQVGALEGSVHSSESRVSFLLAEISRLDRENAEYRSKLPSGGGKEDHRTYGQKVIDHWGKQLGNLNPF